MSKRPAYFERYNAARPHRLRGKPGAGPLQCLGLDGEGFDHGSVYAYMACSTRTHEVSTCEDLRGLSTQAVLDWLLELPKRPLKFGFSLGYDYTKWLADLPNESLYSLCRPESRMPPEGEDGPPRPIDYVVRAKGKDGSLMGKVTDVYQLNLLGTRLSIQKYVGHGKLCDGHYCTGCKLGPKTVVWDVFKFFQSSFVKACLDWGVITQTEFETLKEMKDKRPNFARPFAGEWGEAPMHPEWRDIKSYCHLETRKMAELAERLLDAHREAGLTLKQYFGAGSTGAAMLDKMSARTFIRKKHQTKTGNKVQWRRIEYSPELRMAIACAFFGGRFEISRYGPITEPCWSYDISSAYPYAFTFLPCLVHGAWRHVKGPRAEVHAAVERARVGLVRYVLPYSRFLGYKERGDETAPGAWGPFPFRMPRGLEPVCPEGSIVFPRTSGGGWVGRDEYLAGCTFSPNVVATEAWVYETPCDCKVLRHLMPENYKMRMLWGKEGKGVVAKLGQNSCYGKCAQTKGRNPPYQEFVWALLTTGSCRGQLLRAMATDREAVVLLATDGIIATRPLSLETPTDTATSWAPCAVPKPKDRGQPIYREEAASPTGWVCNKPLGGWEEKPLKDGVFLIRPGIAFPLGIEKLSEDDQKKAEAEFKARGIGKGVLRSLRETVVTDWDENGPRDHKTEKQMFHGMKSQVYVTPSGEHKRTERYGRFGMQPQVISYAPMPKRPGAEADGRFLSWAFGQDRQSIPYKPILGMPKDMPPIVAQLEVEKALEADADDFHGDEIREF